MQGSDSAQVQGRHTRVSDVLPAENVQSMSVSTRTEQQAGDTICLERMCMASERALNLGRQLHHRERGCQRLCRSLGWVWAQRRFAASSEECGGHLQMR